MTGTHSAPSWEHRHETPGGQLVTHSHTYGDYAHGHEDKPRPPAGLWEWKLAERKTCAYCGVSGIPERFEAVNAGPSVACKAVTVCALRQEDREPASFLARLLRELSSPAEIRALTTRELAELDYDLRGPYPRDWANGFLGALRMQLGGRGDSGEVIAAVEADRLARKRRRAALKGAATRKANREAATS